MIIDLPTRDAWHAARAQRFGASEVAAVLGVSPWSTPLQVWARIKAPALYTPPTGAHLDDGTRWESVALQLYRPARGTLVVRSTTVAVHDDRPWLLATPDAWICEPDRYFGDAPPLGLVEIKTDRSRGALEAWPADGTEIRDYGDDEAGPIPIWYWLQCQTQIGCTHAPWVDLQVWIPLPMAMPVSRTIRVYPDRRWPQILAALDAWHTRHILGDDVPDASDDAERERLARWRYPPREEARRADAEEEALIRGVLEAARRADDATDEARRLRTDLIERARGARLWSPSGDLVHHSRGPRVQPPRSRR